MLVLRIMRSRLDPSIESILVDMLNSLIGYPYEFVIAKLNGFINTHFSGYQRGYVRTVDIEDIDDSTFCVKIRFIDRLLVMCFEGFDTLKAKFIGFEVRDYDGL